MRSKRPLIGGEHKHKPSMVTDPGVIRRNHLCLDEGGHRATAMMCQFCESRCRWGERYLELMEIPYKKQGRSTAGAMLTENPGLSLQQRLNRMRLGTIAGGHER